MLTREDLLHMRNMSFEDINPAEIPDLDQMDIDVTKSKKKRFWASWNRGGILIS